LGAVTAFSTCLSQSKSLLPLSAEADVINTLEGTSYHQGGWMVDNYLDNFQTLVSDAGYTDPQTLVVKFRRDLKLGIQNQIATMPYGQPADTDPDAWYRAARRINQVRLTNEAFQSMSHCYAAREFSAEI